MLYLFFFEHQPKFVHHLCTDIKPDLVQVQNLMGGRLKAAVTGSAPWRKTVKKTIH